MDTEPPQARRWKRRTFLAAMLSAMLSPLGYVGYRVAARKQWIIVTRGRRAFDVGVEPKPVRPDGGFSLLIVDDTGKDTLPRTAVIEAMRRHASWSKPNAAMLLGDNFYGHGVDSVDDPRFDSDFESLFDADSFDMPFYVCLGNHDVHGDAEAQVEYTSRSRRWKMPARYYRTHHTAGEATVDCFVVDTSTLLTDSQEIQWLRSELRDSDADYKIVVGRHPALTGGHHGVVDRIGRVLPPLFDEFVIDVYLSGHDHDLQLLRSNAGWLQVVSGSGSRLRSTSWIDETLFAEATAGFSWTQIDKNGLSLSCYDIDERLLTHVVPQGPKASPG